MSRFKPENLYLEELPVSPYRNDRYDKLTLSEYSPYLPTGESSFSLDKPPETAVSGEDNTQLLQPVRRGYAATPTSKTRNDSSTSDVLVPILVLCSFAALPALMGALFYASLGFKAKHGTFYSNGTFVRPLHEGIKFGGEQSFLTTHFSPLLLSSISSSLIGILSPAVMGLMGYHLASMWLRSSTSGSATLGTPNPTPMQYFHTMDLVSNASLMAFLRLVIYIIKREWSRRRSSRRTHVRITHLLWLAGSTMFSVLAMAWAIRVVDIVLHSQVTSTLIYTVDDRPQRVAANAVIKAGCEDSVVNTCGVINRTIEASTGGLNQSLAFRVYEHGMDDLSRPQSVAFIGPVDPPANLILEANTLVASTHCDVYHPECYVQDLNIRVCGPTVSNNMSEAPPLDRWNHFPWTAGFNTTSWQMRLQTFLTLKGNLTSPNAKPPYSLSSGSNLNPFTTTSFGCFPDYGNIPYNDSDMNFRTPYINWWTYGAGIGNKPFQLCSVSICNTTVYDAKYNLTNGIPVLDNSSFTLANASAAVAVSGAGMFLGTGDSLFYQWGPRFIDDQMQIDLSAAGNTYGNDTSQFSAAWAQAFSNRYLGWTAGMVELADHPAKVSNPQVALSIPVATSYLFTVLHFVYAAGIAVLGISSLYVVRRGFYDMNDIQAAHQRLSDISVLVHELTRSSLAAGNDAGSPWTGKVGGELVSDERTQEHGSGEYVDNEVSVGLRRRTNGNLGLSFQRTE